MTGLTAGSMAVAAGPLQLLVTREIGEAAATLRASAASYAHAWREHFGRDHEPVRLLGDPLVGPDLRAGGRRRIGGGAASGVTSGRLGPIASPGGGRCARFRS